jgi:hypothetical protein
VFAAQGVSVIKTTTAEVRDGGIDVRDLLVKVSLGQADFSDLLQQTLEVILVEKCAIFHVASLWQKCGLHIRIIEVLEFLKSKDKFLE